MVSARKGHATYQDILDLPENMVGELIDGERGDERVLAEPFDAIELDLAKLWQW